MREATFVYCLLCRSGLEQQVKEAIVAFIPHVTVLSPTRVMQEKRGGVWREQEKPLLPGYLFLYSDELLPYNLLSEIRHAYRILSYEKKQRLLQGEDLAYAMWLYRHDGQIRPSAVLEVDQEIKVIEGPLANMTGTIKRMDKKKRRAWVSFHFAGEERLVALSVNYLKEEQQKKNG